MSTRTSTTLFLLILIAMAIVATEPAVAAGLYEDGSFTIRFTGCFPWAICVF